MPRCRVINFAGSFAYSAIRRGFGRLAPFSSAFPKEHSSDIATTRDGNVTRVALTRRFALADAMAKSGSSISRKCEFEKEMERGKEGGRNERREETTIFRRDEFVL